MSSPFCILTNIPTPYRAAFFTALDLELKSRGSHLHVLYCGRIEPNRHWDVDAIVQPYSWEYLDPGYFQIKGIGVYRNKNIKKRLRELQPTHLLIAGSWHYPTVWAATRTPIANLKQAFWYESHSESSSDHSWLTMQARKWALKKVKSFAVPGELSDRYVANCFGADTYRFILHNTVDESVFTHSKSLDSISLRKQHEIEESSVVFICAAQLEHKKGVKELVLSMLNRPELKDSYLLLLGEGSLRAELTDLANPEASRVRVVGHVNAATLAEYMAMADAFVLPSRRDPNPLSPIEASFAGKALVLSTRCGNFKDLVKKSETGIAIEEVSEDGIGIALAEAVSLGRPGLATLGRNANQLVENEFLASRVAKKLYEDMDSITR